MISWLAHRWNLPHISRQPLESVRLFDSDVAWQRLSKLDLMELWTWSIKGVLSLVIVTLLIALTGGALKTFWDIRLLVAHSAEVVLRQIIVNTLILLAIVEVFKTTVTYFREGRVKVSSSLIRSWSSC